MLTPKELKRVKDFKKKSLNESKYRISFHNHLSSVDVEIARFRNFVTMNDSSIISQIRIIKKVENLEISISEWPFKMPDDESSFFLLSDLSDIGRVIRYESIKETIRFSEELKEVVKLEFHKNDPHRIFAHMDTNSKNLKILFLDPYHHVAQGVEAQLSGKYCYQNCKDKTVCIKIGRAHV